jgi:putative hydrolase of the HAD superfamily
MPWVMFDYGGVVCTPQTDGDLATLATTAGVSVPEFWDAYWPLRPGYDAAAVTAEAYWQAVSGRLGRSFTPAQIGELTRLDTESWFHLQEGTVSLLGDLAAAGQRLALLSNAPTELARAVEAMPLAGRFEQLLFSCDLRAIKPDPVCFGKALSRLGAPAAEVTFVDDRAENVAAAGRLGLRAILFTDPGRLRADLAGIIGSDRLLFPVDAYRASLGAG